MQGGRAAWTLPRARGMEAVLARLERGDRCLVSMRSQRRAGRPQQHILYSGALGTDLFFGCERLDEEQFACRHQPT